MADRVCEAARRAREAVEIYTMVQKAGESVQLIVKETVMNFAADVASKHTYVMKDPPVPDDLIIPAGMEELLDVVDIFPSSMIPLTPSVVRLFSTVYPESVVQLERCNNGMQCIIYTMATTSPDHDTYPTSLPPPIALVDIDIINSQLVAGHPVVDVTGECLFCHLTSCVSMFLCRTPVMPRVRMPHHDLECNDIRCHDIAGVPVPYLSLKTYRVNMDGVIPVVESPLLKEIHTRVEYMATLRKICNNVRRVSEASMTRHLLHLVHTVYTAIWKPAGVFYRMYCRGVQPSNTSFDDFCRFVKSMTEIPGIDYAMFKIFDDKWKVTLEHVQDGTDFAALMEALRTYGKTVLPVVHNTVIRYTLPRGNNAPQGVVSHDTVQQCSSCEFLMAGVKVMELAGGAMAACSADMMKPASGRCKRGSTSARKTFHPTRCGKLVDSSAVYAYISLVPGGRSLGITLCVCGRKTVMHAGHFTGTYWRCVFCVQSVYRRIYTMVSRRGQQSAETGGMTVGARCVICKRSTDRVKRFHNACFRVTNIDCVGCQIEPLCEDCASQSDR